MRERDLTDLERVDLKSREQWANACASTLMTVLGREGAQIMVARGFNEFLRHAKQEYHGHAFKFDDYKAIFTKIRLFAEGKLTAQAVLR